MLLIGCRQLTTETGYWMKGGKNSTKYPGAITVFSRNYLPVSISCTPVIINATVFLFNCTLLHDVELLITG